MERTYIEETDVNGTWIVERLGDKILSRALISPTQEWKTNHLLKDVVAQPNEKGIKEVLIEKGLLTQNDFKKQ